MSMFESKDADYLRTYAQEAAMVDASELIADGLERSGISQADLARKLGISKSEISARIAGERNITVRKLADTLHALGCRLELRSTPIAEPEPQSSEGHISEFERYAATLARMAASPHHDRAKKPSVNQLHKVMS